MINVRWSSISLQLKHHNVYASRYMQKIHKYSWSLGIGGPFRVVNFVDSQVMNMQMTVLLQSVILFDYLKPYKRLVRTTKYLIDSRCGVEKPSHCDRTICINVAYIDFSYICYGWYRQFYFVLLHVCIWVTEIHTRTYRARSSWVSSSRYPPFHHDKCW